MTEDESILQGGIANYYWTEHSKLIGRCLSCAPEHLRDELMMKLSDCSSVYGSGYDKYVGPVSPALRKAVAIEVQRMAPLLTLDEAKGFIP